MANDQQLVNLFLAGMHNTSQGPMQAQHSGALHTRASSTDKLQDWKSTPASTASDMLEDSCWTGLPDLDLTDSAGLQSELFASEVASSQSPSMFNLANADCILPQRLNDTLFSDHQEALANMDLESILADHDCMLRSTPDKQIQPNTSSASNNHLDDFLQQLYPSRSCSPASREIAQQGSQSQESAAAVKFVTPAELLHIAYAPGPAMSNYTWQACIYEYALRQHAYSASGTMHVTILPIFLLQCPHHCLCDSLPALLLHHSKP